MGQTRGISKTHSQNRPNVMLTRGNNPMSDQIRLRLEEVLLQLPCPVAGCWGMHGAKTSYYYDNGCESHVREVWPKALEEPRDHVGDDDDQSDAEVSFG